MKDFDVVVLGSGIAGMTAAIYLKRANVNVCVVEKNAPGGQINMINEINNYPGFKSIPGPSFAFNVFDQMRELDIPYKYGTAKEIISKDDCKVVKLSDEDITCKSVIIATGRRPRELNLENEKKLIGSGISYCSLCDGTLYKGKDVCVVGGGNSAVESALYLSDIAKKVYLVHRSELKAESMSIDLLKKKKNIKLCIPNEIKEIQSIDNRVSGIVLKDDTKISLDGIFVNVGNVPVPVKCDGLELNNNYIVVDKNMKTSVDKIYACGDIILKDVYQISTAVGEATIAAMSAKKEI